MDDDLNYDEAKEDALKKLSAVLDKATDLVRKALRGRGYQTLIKRVDYVAQVIVVTFPDAQPTSEVVDTIGEEMRHVWPDMPDMTATLFKVSQMNADLIVDLHHPSGIKALAEEGNVKALAAVASGKEFLPVIHYTIDPETGKSKVEHGQMGIHEQPL